MRMGDRLIIPGCFSLDMTTFFESLQILSYFQFILVKREFHVVHTVIKLIEEELEFIDIDFLLISKEVLWLRVLMVNS